MVYNIRVPATSANIGAGFDSIGIALNLYNTFEFSKIDSGLVFEGFEERFSDENNIIWQAMNKTFEKAGYKKDGYKISLVKQEIPVTRGLGSSSSCIVAGILAANSFLEKKFSVDELIGIGVEIEGHPDNVVPAILGGFVVAVVEKSKVYYNKVEIDRNMSFFAGIPSFELSTSGARKVLPKKYNADDVRFNISRAALTTASFNSKNYELLKVACDDKFHQPYRSILIKDYDKVRSIFAKNEVICSFLSGAGPTIIAIKENYDNINKDFISIENDFKKLDDVWLLKSLRADNIGAIVEER